MMSIVSTISGSKQALILISLIVVIAIVDSQFINIFYGTDLGTPGNLHLLLFVSFAIVASVINTILLRFVKRNENIYTITKGSNLKYGFIMIKMVYPSKSE
ncbi:MAG: hypothetical protein WBP64_04330 [Nitrososphaeraceae archaeon]